MNAQFSAPQMTFTQAGPRQMPLRNVNSMTNSVQPAFVATPPIGDSSQYVMVDKTKITAVISQLLSLLSELHQAPPAPANTGLISSSASAA